jgi:hypothetical protein
MGSIIGKRINGRTYYYYAESRRVGGRPRVAEQRYLGTADEIEASLGGAAAEPEHSRHLAFGRVAAVWSTIRQFDLAGIVDRAVGRQRAKVSTGTQLELAVLHRACAQGAELATWWAGTSAGRFVRPRLPDEAFAPPLLSRAARRIGPDERNSIEQAVAAEMANRLAPGGAALPALIVDLPNFATSVPPETEARAAGASLLVSRHGAVPLAGRGHDSGSYRALVAELAARHREHDGDAEITRVFDASQQAQFDLDRGLPFVGGLLPVDHPELLTHPAAAHTAVDPQRLPGVTALDTRATVSGTSRRVLVIHSRSLHSAQSREFIQALNHATRRLEGLAEALRSGAYRHTREQVLSEIARITRVRWVDRILRATVSGTRPGEMRLDWRIDDDARGRLDTELFGKQLLVTDRDEWSAAEVIVAYRARNHVDATFRRINEPVRSSGEPGSPDRQWHPDQIAVDRLVSVLAVAVTHLMRHEADHAGLNLSVSQLLEHLDGIQETVLRYPSTGGRPRTRRVITDRDETQQRLYALFRLNDFAPRGRKK